MSEKTCAAFPPSQCRDVLHAQRYTLKATRHKSFPSHVHHYSSRETQQCREKRKKKWNNFFFSIYGGSRKSSTDPGPCKSAFLAREKHGNSTRIQDPRSDISALLPDRSTRASLGSWLA